MNARLTSSVWSCLILMMIIGVGCLPAAENNNSTPLAPTKTEEISLPQSSPTLTLTPESTPTDNTIESHRQWAISAVDNKGSQEADFAVGEPDADGCELSPPGTSWVYLSEYYQPETNIDSHAYLQLYYANPVVPIEVNLHLTYTYQAVTQVTLIDLEGEPHTVYEGAPITLNQCPFVQTIETAGLSEPVYAVRLDLATLDSNEESNITAIDAVELVGTPLSASLPTPIPTPYLTVSSLGFNASEIPAGFVSFSVIDLNTNQTLLNTLCDIFSTNLTDTDRTLRIFSCDDQTEIWLYVPEPLTKGESPLNTYPKIPTAKLFFQGTYIPAMEGNVWLDQVSNSAITGVLDFSGFNPQNNVDYYRTVAVFNEIPLNEENGYDPGEMVIQWADDVNASSELSPHDNSAAQALGPSDTWQDCTAAPTAWQPEPSNDEQWIEFYFRTPVQPTALNILFTDIPEPVAAVNFISGTNYYPLDITSARVLEGCPTALTFDPINDVLTGITGVQIIFTKMSSGIPLGIDAIQLIGIVTE